MGNESNAGVWHVLSTQEDIDHLLNLFGVFHDSCVREMHVWTGHFVNDQLGMTCEPSFNLRVLFQRQWREPSAIEMVFGEVESLKWVPAKPNYEDIIFRAWLFRDEDTFVWSLAPPEEFTTWTHVTSRKVW